MLSFWILFMTARFGVCHFLWSNHVGHVTNLPQTGTCTVYVLTGGLLLSYVNIFVGVIGLSGPDNFATVHYPLWWQQCSPKKDKSCFCFLQPLMLIYELCISAKRSKSRTGYCGAIETVRRVHNRFTGAVHSDTYYLCFSWWHSSIHPIASG